MTIQQIRKRKKTQSGQALAELAVCLIALMVVLLGFFLITALTMGNVENVIDAREEADKRSREGTLGGEHAQNISHWEYGNRDIPFTADDVAVLQSDIAGVSYIKEMNVPGDGVNLVSPGTSDYLQSHYNPASSVSSVNVFLHAANLSAGTTRISDPLERRNLANLRDAFNRMFGVTKFEIEDTVYIPARADVPDPETATR